MMARIDSKKAYALSAIGIGLFLLSLFSYPAIGGESDLLPKMPGHWKVISDYHVPVEQVKTMSSKLGVNLSSVRNSVYEVNGKRLQINVIATPDPGITEKLMTKLKSMKSEEALVRKGLIVYEFVGKNDVLPLIAEGRQHLVSK
jgi:hypothetical protein